MPIAILFEQANYHGASWNIDRPGTWVIPPGTTYGSVQVSPGFSLSVGPFTVGDPVRQSFQSFPAPVGTGTVQVIATAPLSAPAGYSFTPSYAGQAPSARDTRTGALLYRLETPLWQYPRAPRRRRNDSLFSNPLAMMLLLGGR